jgi:transglycosylase-like protein with SLT domain
MDIAKSRRLARLAAVTVAVGMAITLAPGVASAAAAPRNPAPNGSVNHPRPNVPDAHKMNPRPPSNPAPNNPAPSNPGPSDSGPADSSAGAPAPAPQPQRKDKPPDRDSHKFSPSQRTPAGQQQNNNRDNDNNSDNNNADDNQTQSPIQFPFLPPAPAPDPAQDQAPGQESAAESQPAHDVAPAPAPTPAPAQAGVPASGQAPQPAPAQNQVPASGPGSGAGAAPAQGGPAGVLNGVGYVISAAGTTVNNVLITADNTMRWAAGQVAAALPPGLTVLQPPKPAAPDAGTQEFHPGEDPGAQTLDDDWADPMPDHVRAWIDEAIAELAKNGVQLEEGDAELIWQIIAHESSGDPNAINDWDVNAQNGTPSQGLMQTIPSTFADNMFPGHEDILNPVDNIMAGVNYAIGRYGSLSEVPGIASMREGGPYVGYSAPTGP